MRHASCPTQTLAGPQKHVALGSGKLYTQAVRLYDFLPSGNGYRVRLVLTQLALEFEYREVDILAAETRQPWFLAKNPVGQIPVLELDDGTCLSESTAILFYLAEGTPLLPQEQLKRVRVQQWIAFEQSSIDGVISRARFRRLFPGVVPTEEREFSAWLEGGYHALSVMNQHLRRRTYFVDERYTIADAALYSYTHCASEGGYDLSRFQHVLAWLERVRQQPGHIRIDQRPPGQGM